MIPLSIGMWLRAHREEWVARRQEIFQRIAFGVFLAIVIGVIAAENDRVTENFAEVAGATITLNLAAMAISFTVSRLPAWTIARRRRSRSSSGSTTPPSRSRSAPRSRPC